MSSGIGWRPSGVGERALDRLTVSGADVMASSRPVNDAVTTAGARGASAAERERLAHGGERRPRRLARASRALAQHLAHVSAVARERPAPRAHRRDDLLEHALEPALERHVAEPAARVPRLELRDRGG